MSAPYIAGFQLENFKSYHRMSTLRLAPLTLLMGANASGKSNLIEALRLLCWLVQGNTTKSLKDKINEPFRGKIKDLPYKKEVSFKLGTTMASEGTVVYLVNTIF